MYRIIGTTDENTECNHCGRIELKFTVVFDTLDADGNQTGDLYYAGSSCATKLPGFTHRSAASIRSDARRIQTAADRAAAAKRQWAREILAKYSAVENARGRDIASVFFGFNPTQRGRMSARDAVTEMLADARAALAGYEWEPVAPAEAENLFNLADAAAAHRAAGPNPHIRLLAA